MARQSRPLSGPNAASDAAQLERFKEAACALGCDDDEAAFDAKLKVLARQKLPGAKDQVAKPGDKGNKGRATNKTAG